MRYYEISSGLSQPVFNEESELIDKIIENKSLANDKLNIREQELARKLVSRGLLERKIIDEELFYVFNE